MKKLLAILLSALMLFCFAGCSAELTDEDYQAIYDVIEDVIAEEADSWDSEENYEDADDITAYESEGDGVTEEPDISEAPEEVIEDIDTGEDIPEDIEEETEAETTTAATTTTVTTTTTTTTTTTAATTEETEAVIDFDGTYTKKDDVALYIHTYGCLPKNFISKKEAQALGWEGGSLEPYAPGMCIGGSHFGNFEGLLPEKKGRKYTECDIDTLGKKSRGAKRIVFSNDGLIYYTDDHYESFELLYGEE